MSEAGVPNDQPIRLAELGAELLAGTSDGHGGGRSARTVLHGAGLRATIIALRAGHELSEHAGPLAATLFVQSGQVILRTADREQPVVAGELAAIPTERHSLHAETDAIVLLTSRFD